LVELFKFEVGFANKMLGCTGTWRRNILILTEWNIIGQWIRNIAANKIGKNMRKFRVIEYIHYSEVI
jgi:hypothetical protein